jgi:ATP-dependent RNA helicase DDX3X
VILIRLRIGRTGRAGNTGTATALMNTKNVNLASELLDRLQEAQQEVPEFLERMARATTTPRRGGGGRGHSMRDYRHGVGSATSNAGYGGSYGDRGGGGYGGDRYGGSYGGDRHHGHR